MVQKCSLETGKVLKIKKEYKNATTKNTIINVTVENPKVWLGSNVTKGSALDKVKCDFEDLLAPVTCLHPLVNKQVHSSIWTKYVSSNLNHTPNQGGDLWLAELLLYVLHEVVNNVTLFTGLLNAPQGTWLPAVL